MRPRVLALSMLCVSVAAVSLTGCSPGSSSTAAPSLISTDCAGVTVIVNFGLLGNPDGPGDVHACSLLSTGTQSVADALEAVSVTTEGTAKYGDQVLCRVNGLPAANQPVTVPGHKPFTESCSTMAPEYAYWALWIRHPGAAWDYATEGVSTQKVAPGDLIGIVFTTGGATPTPDN
jgi:hypothetical protein